LGCERVLEEGKAAHKSEKHLAIGVIDRRE
jgi:hypothetical protein